MSTIAIYENSVLATRNKVGKMAKDDRGYREICLGAFECMTEKGELYRFTKELEAMFQPGSRLRTQIDTGRMRGEAEHPSPIPGMTFSQFLNRVRSIDNRFVGHQIRQVRLEEGKDHKGNRIIKVFGWVIGSGIYGPQLEKKFDNPDENVDFSIRTLCHPTQTINGVPNKRIKLIVTWDQVNHGGLACSNKYDTPSMEGIDDVGQIWTPDAHAKDSVIWTPENGEPICVTEASLFQAEEEAKAMEAIGMESNELISATMIRTELGWEKTQLIDPRSSSFW